MMAPGRVPEALRPTAQAISDATRKGHVAPQLKTLFDFIEAELSESEWFAGDDFSTADVMMSYPLEAGGSRAGAFEGRPKLKAFLERIHARAAYRAAFAKGGPYAYAA